MIRSLYPRELVERVREELASSQHFRIASAMVSMAGVDLIYRSIERCMERDGCGQILIGVDLPSDPNAIERLRGLASKYASQLDLKYFRPLRNRIFHPKLFLFRKRKGKTSAIIGSSNLTGGGLTENHEANIWVRSGSVVSELTEYFDEHFEGAYSSQVTSEWLADYRDEWLLRKKLFDQLRRLRQKSQAKSRRHAPQSRLPKRIKDSLLAFTGGIRDWPRRELYPLVRRLGGWTVEVDSVRRADGLVHAEFFGGRKTSRKLQNARKFKVPVMTEEDFWALARRENVCRRKEGKGPIRFHAKGRGF
jgi:HKD family nuclease